MKLRRPQAGFEGFRLGRLGRAAQQVGAAQFYLALDSRAVVQGAQLSLTSK